MEKRRGHMLIDVDEETIKGFEMFMTKFDDAALIAAEEEEREKEKRRAKRKKKKDAEKA